jgi:hypothetical protein
MEKNTKEKCVGFLIAISKSLRYDHIYFNFFFCSRKKKKINSKTFSFLKIQKILFTYFFFSRKIEKKVSKIKNEN